MIFEGLIHTQPTAELACSVSKAILLNVCIFTVMFVFQNFAKEMMIDDIHEMKEDKIISEVQKAGGANYGVGK